MKKLILISLIPLLPFAFTGCEDDLVPGQEIPNREDQNDNGNPIDENIPPANNTIPADAIIDNELLPGVETFVFEANRRGVQLDMSQLSVNFADTGDDLGTCQTFSDGRKVILINETFRSGNDPSYTVIHELGHCVLRMEHRDEALSIMNTFENDAELRATDQTALFNEFFDETRFNEI